MLSTLLYQNSYWPRVYQSFLVEHNTHNELDQINCEAGYFAGDRDSIRRGELSPIQHQVHDAGHAEACPVLI